LDHSRRQAASESDNKRRLAGFGPKQAEASLNTYLKALARRPEDWPIHFNLALFYQELKREKEAGEQFKYLVNRFPQMKPFRIGLANSLISAGNKAGALEQFRQALSLDPSDKEIQRQVDELGRFGGSTSP